MRKTISLRREEISPRRCHNCFKEESEFNFKSSQIEIKNNYNVTRGFEKDLSREKMFMPRFPSAKSDYVLERPHDDAKSSPEPKIDLRKKKKLKDDVLPN